MSVFPKSSPSAIARPAKGVVVNTGMRTFLGGVAADLAGGKGLTDFDKGLAEKLRAGAELETPGWRAVALSETPFARGRRELEGVALKTET
jgi:hypothetical protein